MTITPVHLPVGQLFQQNFIFRVPKYQRYYAWDDEQIEDFLKDLDVCVAERRANRTRHHFLGGIVTVATPHVGSARRNVEVVDGQQRLATFTLLALALRRAMKALAAQVSASAANSPAEYLESRAASLWRQYESFQDSVALQVLEISRLELSKPDKAFFDALLQGQPVVPARRSHEMLLNAYDRIAAKLNAMVAAQATDVEKAESLSFVDAVLANDWTVIHMEASDRREAYMLFQVLNDRGAGLTEGELLRAKTLEILDNGGSAAQSQTVEDAWDAILAGQPERINEGLRWIYNSYKGERPRKASLFDDFLAVRYPMHSAAQLTPVQASTVVANTITLKDDFDRMARISDGAWPYAVPSPQVPLWDRDRLRLLIVELKLVVCMPLLIPASTLDQQIFARIVHVLERFMFRYKVIVNARIEAAMRIYGKHAQIIRAAPATFDLALLVSDLNGLLALHAPDALFRSRLDEMRYTKTATNKPLKYLLLTLDAYEAWYAAGAVGVPTADKTTVADFTHNTLEHVYPQNSVAPVAAMEERINRLGNIAVLSPADNAAAGNLEFAVKKPILQNSLSRLNRRIGATPVWDSVAVDDRQALIRDMALKIFAL